MKFSKSALTFALSLAGTADLCNAQDWMYDYVRPSPGYVQAGNQNDALLDFCAYFFPDARIATQDDLSDLFGFLHSGNAFAKFGATDKDSGLIFQKEIDGYGLEVLSIGWSGSFGPDTESIRNGRANTADKARQVLCYADDPDVSFSGSDDEIQKFRVTSTTYLADAVSSQQLQDEACEQEFGVGVKSTATAQFIPMMSLIAYLRSLGYPVTMKSAITGSGAGAGSRGPWHAKCGSPTQADISYETARGLKLACANGYSAGEEARLLCYADNIKAYSSPLQITWTPDTVGDPAAAIPKPTTLAPSEAPLPVIEAGDYVAPTSAPSGNHAKQASSNGDPHFKTFSGERFDFHGGCDLVLFHNKNFANGLGLTVHIRTKINTWWSFIESAVLRLGDSTLELRGGANGATYWINGEHQVEQDDGTTFRLSGFPVVLRAINTKKLRIRVELGKGDAISMENFKDFVSVNVRATSDRFKGSVGMMGSFPLGQRLARDGKTIMEDANAFGQEWQVLASEPMLFHSDKGSVQPPQMCAMPDKMAKKRRRLGEALITEVDASIACAHAKEDEYDACIFDVLATNDKEMGGAY